MILLLMLLGLFVLVAFGVLRDRCSYSPARS